MPITFDTLEELKAFYRNFRLEDKLAGGRGAGLPKLAVKSGRGRKPGKIARLAKAGRKPGRPPSAVARAPKKLTQPKGDTLTSKIQATIQSFLNAGRSFTANEVYDDLVLRVPTVNKQSVITSVLKQMNSTFKQISVTERPGNGPRPVKLYNSK